MKKNIFVQLLELENVLNMDVPKSELLAELSSSSVPVTRGLIESLRDDPDVELLSQHPLKLRPVK